MTHLPAPPDFVPTVKVDVEVINSPSPTTVLVALIGTALTGAVIGWCACLIWLRA